MGGVVTVPREQRTSVSPTEDDFPDPWDLLGSLCDAVAELRQQGSKPQVRFAIDPAGPGGRLGMRFTLRAAGLSDRHFLFDYMRTFEGRPPEMSDVLWRGFSEDPRLLRVMALVIEWGTPRAELGAETRT